MDNPTVLVAEDEAHTRQAYAALLEDAGYRVLEATNGGEAIVQVRRHEPDLVVMDLVMPVVDGIEAAESLRAYPLPPGPRSSASPATRDGSSGSGCGASATSCC